MKGGGIVGAVFTELFSPNNLPLEETMNKATVHTALIALAAYAAVSFIQRSVIAVPVIGAYLPGGTATVVSAQ